MYSHRAMLSERFGDVYIADKQTLERLQNKPIDLKFSVENAYDGQALYFREALKDLWRRIFPTSMCTLMA